MRLLPAVLLLIVVLGALSEVGATLFLPDKIVADSCWVEKSQYKVGERVRIFVQLVSGKTRHWVVIYKPNGSPVRIGLPARSGTFSIIAGSAGPPLGQRTVELWAQMGATKAAVYTCYFSVVKR